MAYRAGFDRRWPAGGVQFAEPFASRARAPVFRDSVDTANLSAGNETSGTLSNTEYTIQSGEWKVVSDADSGCGQSAECQVAGVTYNYDTSASGTWFYNLSKDDGSFLRINFIADTPQGANLPVGYQFAIAVDESVRIRRINGAVQATLIQTNPGTVMPGRFYEYAITRSAGNVFSVYAKGNEYLRWTLLGESAADATYTDSQYSVYDLAAGEKFYCSKHLQGVVSPI